MHSFRIVALMGSLGSVLAQNMSVCDKYTTALLKDNNSTNQYTLLTLLVNTVVIGNYTTDPAPKNAVPGILVNGTYKGKEVNLLPYFDGTLLSSNRGGASGVSINFLDDGGAEPLKKNMPANGKNSMQYKLLTHLYQFFGKLLACSTYGTGDFPAYSGHSMASAHMFMDLGPSEVGYFIQQVGLAATSFGVSTDDVTAVAGALDMLFGYRCSPATEVIPEQGKTLNSICQNELCPLDRTPTCAAYPNNSTVVEPGTVGMNGSATGTGLGVPSATASGVSVFEGKVGSVRAGIGAVVGALAFAVAL
ncbi:hypothetical protein P280DRAFT_406352 [Massarina eburnea CBS 473.64]|uniref:Uncharacterized protein n=1 Tax=Massarina eburnea CBS 473.64 TaxID=1395130 RepID=A0A6A6RR41_9PLEO|nr:hypothetical protein P280DRAFT_406352 [Massarina eburnea CBS 473.64]